jgi:type III pantothenate kinase
MAWLLVDNSNTRTKFALGDDRGLLEWRGTLATGEVTPEALENLLGNLEFSASLIGSVVPLKAAVLSDWLSQRGPVHLLGPDSPLGIGIDYPNPSQIGADRLANAVGAVHRHRAPAIVIDFGTAVTFDVIDSPPAWCGGVIAPGLGAMGDYLTRKTALLPVMELAEPPSAIGKSTVHAMQAGAVYGYRGLVKEILSQLQEELPGDPVIIATGGDAALIAAGVPQIQVVDPDITLDGLRHVAAAVF